MILKTMLEIMLETLQNMKNKSLLLVLVGIVFWFSHIPASAQFKKHKTYSQRKSEQEIRYERIVNRECSAEQVRNQINIWKGDYIDYLNNNLNRLTSDIDNVKKELATFKQVERLKSSIGLQNSRVAELRDSLDNLKIYKQISLYEDNLEILNKKYSDIRADELDAISNSVDFFIYRDDFETYKNRVAATESNFELYIEANCAINKECQKSTLDNIYSRLDSLLSIDMQLTEDQKTELTDMRIKVSRYTNGMGVLKSIVKEVNSNEDVIKFREEKNKESCIRVIEKIVRPVTPTMEYTYDRYFKTVPYLGNLINEYWKELQENPFGTSLSENAIINWK